MKLAARPLRPPLLPNDRIAEYRRLQPDPSFITGNGLASRCRYVLNYEPLFVNETAENDWWFCNATFLEYFFREVAPAAPYVLLSHNSDRSIDRRFTQRLDDPNLIAWFAVNTALHHPKLFALPIGIANPNWAHGDASALRAVQSKVLAKTRLFDVSFSVHTCPDERRRCLAETGLQLDPPCSFPEYLERLATSYFCIAPRGVGIDTLRVWEALYLRTVPVVTRSVLTEHHPDLPMIVLDDWSEFRRLEFAPELYDETWGAWSPEELSLDAYTARVSRTVASLLSAPAAAFSHQRA